MRVTSPIRLLLFASGFLMSEAAANVRIPSAVFMSENFEAAKAKAAEEGQGLLFINAHIGATNPNAVSQLESVMRTMQRDAVIVVVPTEGIEAAHNTNIPQGIRSQMRHGTMPGLPRIILSDREAGEIVHRVLSNDLKEDQRGQLRTLREKARALSETQGLAGKEADQPEQAEAMPRPTGREPSTPTPNYLNLTNVDGNTIRAAVLEVSADNVRFRREDGVEFEYPMGQLDEASRQLVREQSGGPTE